MLVTYAVYLFLINIAIWGTSCTHTCEQSNEQCIDTDSNHPELNRITTTSVGEIQEITLRSRKYQLKTISIEPLAFEILNYLTNDECDEIIKVSKTVGLKSSTTRHNTKSRQYQLFDLDNDNYLNLSEIRVTLEQNHDVNLNDQDIIEMYAALGIAQNTEHKLSKTELFEYDPSIFGEYIDNELLILKPWKHSRMSQQSWIYPKDYTPIMTNIHHRLYDLFEVYSIPQYIVNNSYTLQVVHYAKNGKYNAHYDSTFKSAGENIPCCFILSKAEKRRNKGCKSCRYMTVLYYLNDVDNGGCTVFPLSNKYYKDKVFNEAALLEDEDIDDDDDMEQYNPLKWRMSEHNLPEVYCGENVDNLKVKPKKGKALVWFNHLLDDETKWLGDVDMYSMHTGCPILNGEKWIANHWILVNDVPYQDAIHHPNT